MQLRRAANDAVRRDCQQSDTEQTEGPKTTASDAEGGSGGREKPTGRGHLQRVTSDAEESFKSVRSPEPCGVSGGLGGAVCHVAGVEGPEEEEEEMGPLFLKERGRDLEGGSLMDGRRSSVLFKDVRKPGMGV